MRATTAVLMIALAGQAFAATAGETPPPEFRLKQDTPSTGTNIPAAMVTGSSLPFDKTYAELTPEQKDMLRSRYEDLKPGDEPPFPKAGLGAIFRPLGQVRQQFDVEGPLIMYVNVDSQGTPTAVEVVQSPDAKLTRAIANIVMLTAFKPAICGGTPCKMQFPIRVNFTRNL